ncbi:MAG: DUF448 domain-containing protein [Candidatus Cloacimonetes bacterium]|nr:DUF448 domain-containing protein [Candidatus Cloacimonadota bacterium]
MPNKASKADHIALRSCVVCRKQQPQSELLAFKLKDNKVVFDFKRQLSGRGYYVCDDNKCINRMDKWHKRWRKKRK